jgi:hypothetical protein
VSSFSSDGCVTFVCEICGRGGRTLWVIHQILFASKLEITSGASDSVGAKASTVLPGAPGAEVSVSREGSHVLNLTVGTRTQFPGKFMYAFRAVRFRFNSAGEIIDGHDDAGKHMPVHRGDDDGLFFLRNLPKTKRRESGMYIDCQSKRMQTKKNDDSNFIIIKLR